jgi:hypothetical protein
VVGSPGDLPDWTNAILLQGVDGDGNPVSVLLDASGQLYAVLRGVDGSGDPQSVKVDADGQLYTVLQGASGNAVAVDSDGFITAVLKGSVAGTLTTIAVDVNGRIEAFILDAVSQWGDVLRIGNAEMAARLGSGKSWDWRGDQIYYNDFSKGSGNILKYPDGTGSAITVDPTYWTIGGYSLKMVGGSDGDEWAYIDVWLEHPPSLVMGLEAQISGDLNFNYFTIQMKRYVAGNIYWAALRVLRAVPPDIQYLNSAGSWVKIGTSYFGANIEMFNHIKIVADFENFKYVRAMWGETEYDLSAQSLRQSGTGYLNQMQITCHLQARSGQNDQRYLDYVIVTVNEPT